MTFLQIATLSLALGVTSTAYACGDNDTTQPVEEDNQTEQNQESNS